MNAKGSSNSVKLAFFASADHIIVMSVVSSDDQLCALVVTFPGVQSKFREETGVEKELLHDYHLWIA